MISTSVSMATSTLISPLRWQLYLFTEYLSVPIFMLKKIDFMKNEIQVIGKLFPSNHEVQFITGMVIHKQNMPCGNVYFSFIERLPQISFF